MTYGNRINCHTVCQHGLMALFDVCLTGSKAHGLAEGRNPAVHLAAAPSHVCFLFKVRREVETNLTSDSRPEMERKKALENKLAALNCLIVPRKAVSWEDTQESRCQSSPWS